MKISVTALIHCNAVFEYFSSRIKIGCMFWVSGILFRCCLMINGETCLMSYCAYEHMVLVLTFMLD